MEGYFVDLFASCKKVLSHFHSHISDKSMKDEVSRHAHMDVLIQLLITQEKIISGISTILDLVRNTDVPKLYIFSAFWHVSMP